MLQCDPSIYTDQGLHNRIEHYKELIKHNPDEAELRPYWIYAIQRLGAELRIRENIT